MKKAFCYFAAVLVFLAASCSSTKNIEGLAPVYVTNSKAINLLPPDSMEGSVNNLQQLTGDFGALSFSLLVLFEADENGIFMSLLNDFGTDMGYVAYDGKSVQFESAVFPENLKAEYIIADIQNAYYKIEDLEQNFAAVGLGFESLEEDGKSIRRIKNGKNVVEEITISGNSIKIQNILRGYEYNLTGEE